MFHPSWVMTKLFTQTNGGSMRIKASEKYLSFDGYATDAIHLVDSLHEAYCDIDMPKVLNDFVFNIEVALQNAGIYDSDFNLIKNDYTEEV